VRERDEEKNQEVMGKDENSTAHNAVGGGSENDSMIRTRAMKMKQSQ
jgi:hypothetical protein